jgi:hypothetical protein
MARATLTLLGTQAPTSLTYDVLMHRQGTLQCQTGAGRRALGMAKYSYRLWLAYVFAVHHALSSARAVRPAPCAVSKACCASAVCLLSSRLAKHMCICVRHAQGTTCPWSPQPAHAHMHAHEGGCHHMMCQSALVGLWEYHSHTAHTDLV